MTFLEELNREGYRYDSNMFGGSYVKHYPHKGLSFAYKQDSDTKEWRYIKMEDGAIVIDFPWPGNY
jgi:hypothetical protein